MVLLIGAIDCPSISMQVSSLCYSYLCISHIMKMFLEKNKSSMNLYLKVMTAFEGKLKSVSP